MRATVLGGIAAVFLLGIASSPAHAAQAARPLILDHLKNGRVAEAVRIISESPVPLFVKSLYVDRAYGQLWDNPDLAPIFDVKNYGFYQAEIARTLIDKNPRDRVPQMLLIEALRASGRSDQAVTAALQALKSIDRRDVVAAGWMWNEVVYAAIESDQFDVVEQSAVTPYFNANVAAFPDVVSQVINFGRILLLMGRNDDALRMVGRADRFSSVYGKGIIRTVRLCALQAEGKADEAKELFDNFLSGTQPASKIDALFCLNRLDEAAEIVMQELSDPANRSGMLLEMQNCIPNPNLPAGAVNEKAKWLQIRDRPEVRRLVDSVGVIRDYPMPCTMGMLIR